MKTEKEVKNPTQRTAQQNRALHLWFKLVAQTLNSSGLTMRTTLKPEVWENLEMPWNTELVKDFIWRPVQKAMLKKASTTQLTTADIDKVWDVLNKNLGEKLGVYQPFPSIEEIMSDKEWQKFLK